VFLLVDPEFLPSPLNFYKASRFVPLVGWTPLTDTTFVFLCLIVKV